MSGRSSILLSRSTQSSQTFDLTSFFTFPPSHPSILLKFLSAPTHLSYTCMRPVSAFKGLTHTSGTKQMSTHSLLKIGPMSTKYENHGRSIDNNKLMWTIACFNFTLEAPAGRPTVYHKTAMICAAFRQSKQEIVEITKCNVFCIIAIWLYAWVPNISTKLQEWNNVTLMTFVKRY